MLVIHMMTKHSNHVIKPDSLFSERIRRRLVLKRVDSELIAQPAPVCIRFSRKQGLADVDALIAHHGGEERHHGILDVFRGENTKPLRLTIHAVSNQAEVTEGLFVMLGFKAQVALTHDDNLRVHEDRLVSDATDMVLHKLELFLRLCVLISVSHHSSTK